MSDRKPIDSSPLLPVPGPEAPSRSDAEASSLAKPASAKKARRPRPTFDDGALTRTFKFPSKSYPRSSYYVTSTEIIIRLKKARKKWKLIVPKKRVVSYRTNRWFAKPRWVAIELTYTQAVKLGLVEARVRVPDTMTEIDASDTTSPELSETAYSDTSATPSHSDLEAPGEGNIAEYQSDLGDHVDTLGEQDGADDFQLAVDEGEAEPAEPLLQLPPLALHGETAQPHAPAAIFVGEDHTRIVAVVAQRRQSRAAPRRTFRLVITTLAAAITGFAIWAAFDTAPLNPGPECAGPEADARCASSIVTGSIGPGSPSQFQAAAPNEDPLVPVSETAAIERSDLVAKIAAAITPLPAAEEKPDTELPAKPTADDRSVVLSGRDIALPQSPPVFTAAVAAAQPTATSPDVCDGLSAIGRHIQINFDYGLAHLDPAVVAALEDFAAKLRACPGSKVMIEGHTDSDGRVDRNRSLSLRRAQAVQMHLVSAGVDSHRLVTIGFGQTRPAVPNVSQKNKRNNRRVALVVTTQR